MSCALYQEEVHLRKSGVRLRYIVTIRKSGSPPSPKSHGASFFQTLNPFKVKCQSFRSPRKPDIRLGPTMSVAIQQPNAAQPSAVRVALMNLCTALNDMRTAQAYLVFSVSRYNILARRCRRVALAWSDRIRFCLRTFDTEEILRGPPPMVHGSDELWNHYEDMLCRLQRRDEVQQRENIEAFREAVEALKVAWCRFYISWATAGAGDDDESDSDFGSEDLLDGNSSDASATDSYPTRASIDVNGS